MLSSAPRPPRAAALRGRARGRPRLASARPPAAASGEAPQAPPAAASQVLLMQKKLLDQIEERKKLHTELLERLRLSEAAGPVAGAPALPPALAAAVADAMAEVGGGASAPPGGGGPRGGAAAGFPSRATDAAALAAAAAAAAPPAAAESCALPGAEPEGAAPASAPAASASAAPPPPSAAAAAAPEPSRAEEGEGEPGPPAAPAAAAPRCKERLNVVFVAAECAPWSKTGGLGDVAGALPKALASRGHRVMVVAPRYANYPEGWETGVRLRLKVCGADAEVGFFHGFRDGVDFVFVDHPCFAGLGAHIYGGSREALQFRCALLCSAALEAPRRVPCGGAPFGDDSLVFVANDWHTALLPVFLQAHYRDRGDLTYARAVLVLHNMAHQGRGPLSDFNRLGLPEHWRAAFRLDDPVGGTCCNVLKAGLSAAHRLVAVSEGYAWEIGTDTGGWGLAAAVREQAAKLCGVANGIDLHEWNPATDPHLATDGYVRYSASDPDWPAKKAACKAALQRQLGLPVRPDVPLLGFIGRLDYQKGVDLITDSGSHLVGQGAQLVLLGSGTAALEGALRGLEARHRDAARGWVGFSVAMSHRITAGADILLMPSRFEPCGLNQLYAMRYGTVPVVHAVGGLRDTVRQFNPFEDSGTGWTFSPADAGHMNEAVGNAMHTFRAFPATFRGIQVRGMAQDLSWERAAAKYEDVMLGAKYTW